MANVYKNSIVSTTDSLDKLAYTVPAATVALVKSISVYNGAGGSSNITISITDSSASTTTIYSYAASLASLAKKEFLEGDKSTLLVLESADTILIKSSNGASAIITISVLQQDRT